ncbi:IspD/TarI family cytidylyltransferase [Goodfellowiella coeruleoviolacea]|uniref:2-C-methyl-D-erythritol 4-phosphate cytidylyltransferase n=1 Tax=Goodfellowiella coeruleoviolacea TaxID=334858 RepID=A0AAE3KJU8_9PSEU|nr:2-C-methyl-D-erythritol 4-phosphate cytidylyltransferase [Goodfellowiella coeruleoviolacea]MCP2164723.1 2-C-methyl-D-erythritol 4-phosphate cytidylyltransferase [Goodfellowiella coeruleoviolacea]
MSIALVRVATSGERVESGDGEPLLVHAVRGLLDAGCVQQVVVATQPSDVDTVTASLDSFGEAVHVFPDAFSGPAGRIEAARRALDHALERCPDARVVLVHDAARPFTPPETVQAVVNAVLAGNPVVVPVLPLTDTVKQVDPAGVIQATPDRSAMRVTQTPQGFAVDVLRRAYRLAQPDDPASDLELVTRLPDAPRVSTVPGHPTAMRVRTPFDLAVVRAMLADNRSPV